MLLSKVMGNLGVKCQDFPALFVILKIKLIPAGLPNTFGDYDETPEMFSEQLKVCRAILLIYREYVN